jgi:shikimate kinase
MPSLILIGPMDVGKSTVAGLLAQRWGVRRVAMDHIRYDYYREIGYERARADKLYRQHGFAALCAYWKPFEAHAVERLLADTAGERCVIDFGAGHSVYQDPVLFGRVQTALAPHPVVLLLPSSDPDESIAILLRRRDEVHRERKGRPNDMNEHFIRHPSNALLAKFTAYTKGRTPEQTVEEIANLFPPGP